MKCDLKDDYSVAAVGIPSVVLGMVLGALLPPPSPPLPKPQTLVYDCINIQHAPAAASYPHNHEARHALRRLATACEEQEHALALMRVWEADPTAGVVLEETETESK